MHLSRSNKKELSSGCRTFFRKTATHFSERVILERWRRDLIDPTIHAYVSTDDCGALTGFTATRRKELLRFGTAVRLWGSGLAMLFHYSPGVM